MINDKPRWFVSWSDCDDDGNQIAPGVKISMVDVLMPGAPTTLWYNKMPDMRRWIEGYRADRLSEHIAQGEGWFVEVTKCRARQALKEIGGSLPEGVT